MQYLQETLCKCL